MMLSSINIADVNQSLGKADTFVTRLTTDLDMNSSGEVMLMAKVNDVRSTSNSSIDKKSEGTIVHNIDGFYTRATKYKCTTTSYGSAVDVDNSNIYTVENKDDAKQTLLMSSLKSSNGSPIVNSKYTNALNLATSTSNISIVDLLANK